MHDNHRQQGEQQAGRERDPRTGRAAAAARIQQQASWVDLQIRQAMDRGDFDDLPGYGKPLQGLDGRDDPDWWVKKLVERERVVVLPPSLQLRKDDAELDARLDRLGSVDQVRREVAEFNARVRWALYRPPEGPPMITPPRDPDVEADRWRERREAAREVARAAAREAAAQRESARPRRGNWLRRRRG